jgi:hypothetical protein
MVFMEAIQEEDVLLYNSREDIWIFDSEKIQQEIMVSESLADLLIDSPWTLWRRRSHPWWGTAIRNEHERCERGP